MFTYFPKVTCLCEQAHNGVRKVVAAVWPDQLKQMIDDGHVDKDGKILESEYIIPSAKYRLQ